MVYRLFIAVRGVSLLLCVFFAVLWVRSYWWLDVVSATDGAGRYWEVATIPGQVRVAVARGWGRNEPLTWRSGRPTEIRAWFGHQAVNEGWTLAGVAATEGHRTLYFVPTDAGTKGKTVVPYRLVVVPLAVPLFLSFVLPATMTWRMLRRRRLMRQRFEGGLCLRCGYDLRGSTGVCPECGAPAVAAHPQLSPGQ